MPKPYSQAPSEEQLGGPFSGAAAAGALVLRTE
jgi:hypothetical protein